MSDIQSLRSDFEATLHFSYAPLTYSDLRDDLDRIAQTNQYQFEAHYSGTDEVSDSNEPLRRLTVRITAFVRLDTNESASLSSLETLWELPYTDPKTWRDMPSVYGVAEEAEVEFERIGNILRHDLVITVQLQP